MRPRSVLPGAGGRKAEGMASIRMTRGQARLLVDAAALAAFVLSYLLVPLRLGHLALGYAVAVVVLVHLAQRGPAALRALAAAGTARSADRGGRPSYPPRGRAIADIALFALVALTTASGVWQQEQASGAARAWHSTLGTVTLAAALGHTWRRRHVPLRMLRLGSARRRQRPATGAAAGAASAAGSPWISRSRS